MINVILRKDVKGLGRRGEVLEESDGYARNYLIPQGHAMRSTAGAEAQAQAMVKSEEIKDTRARGEAEDIAKRLAPQLISISANASEEGRLFGSVSERDIVDAVYAQTGFELDQAMVELEEPVKDVGNQMVPVALHTDVKIFLQVEISAAEEV